MEQLQAEAAAKKKKIWALVIIGFFALVSALTYAYNDYYIYLSAYLWFGLIYGMCLQYGRFCFASAFRDLFAVGVPRMVVGIMTATLFFAIVSSFVTATGFTLSSILEVVGNETPKPPTLIIVGETVNLRDKLSWFEAPRQTTTAPPEAGRPAPCGPFRRAFGLAPARGQAQPDQPLLLLK